MIELREFADFKKEFFDNNFINYLGRVRRELARFFLDTKFPPIFNMITKDVRL